MTLSPLACRCQHRAEIEAVVQGEACSAQPTQGFGERLQGTNARDAAFDTLDAGIGTTPGAGPSLIALERLGRWRDPLAQIKTAVTADGGVMRPGRVNGPDMPATLALGHARGAPPPAVAELLPAGPRRARCRSWPPGTGWRCRQRRWSRC
jgi:hypothetical protein